MKHYRLLLPLCGLLLATDAFPEENSAIGVWRTESTDEGYLHVTIERCKDYLCGNITHAYNLQDEPSTTYEHIGKSMVWDMKNSGNTSWKDGKIWDPTNSKTYKAKMVLKNEILSVSGCVLFFCKSQNWTRVE